MANKVRHNLHRRSSINNPKPINIERGTLEIKNPKAPLASDIEFGEIAVNYGKESESLFIKNSEGKIIRVNSISNIRYDGDVDKSLNKYLDDRYVNTSGDTMYGSLEIKGQDGYDDKPTFKYEGTEGHGSFEIKSNATKVSGNSLNVIEDKTSIQSKTTDFDGTNMDYDVNNTNVSGETLSITENSTNIDGTDLVINEVNSSLSGTNLTVKETLTDFDCVDFDGDITNVNLSGKTLEIKEETSKINTTVSNQIITPKLDIDSTDTTLDGNNLTVNEKKSITVNTPLYELSGTTTNMEGTDLTVNYGETIDIDAKNINVDTIESINSNSKAINISGTTTSVEGTSLSSAFDNITVNGNNKVHIVTENLDIDSTNSTLDGTNLTINENSTVLNSDEKIDVKTSKGTISANTVTINTSEKFTLDTPKLEFSTEDITVSGNNLTIIEKVKTTIQSKETFIEGDKTRINSEIVEVPNQNYQQAEGAPEFKLNDCLGKQIKVIGIQIGDYQKPNEKIPVGTPIEKILDNILCKTIGVIKHLPTVSMYNSGTATATYEVGSNVTPNLSHRYYDGSFEGAEPLYIDENTGVRYKIKSECDEGITVYYHNSTPFATASTATETYQLKEENVSYHCTTSYEQSKAKPIDTKGNYCTGDTAVIKAGVATSSSITYYGRYKYFLGYINKTEGLTSDEVRGLTTRIGFVNNSSNTTIVSSTIIQSNGNSIVIAMPKGYVLKTVENGIGADIKSNFSTLETVTVNLPNKVKKDYNVYIYPITNGAKVDFKNVSIGK